MSLSLRDVAFLSGVSFAHAYQLAMLARRTGAARAKFKVNYPAITGNEDFERIYRAQQNTLEFFPIFSTTLWLSGIYFHQVPVGIVGIVYIIARQRYYEGYSKSVQGRLPGFKLAVNCVRLMVAMFGIGFTSFLLEEFAGFSVKDHALRYLKF